MVHEHQVGDDPDDNEYKDPPSGADTQWEEDEAQYIWHVIRRPANNPPPPIVKELMKMMFTRLLFH